MVIYLIGTQFVPLLTQTAWFVPTPPVATLVQSFAPAALLIILIIPAVAPDASVVETAGTSLKAAILTLEDVVILLDTESESSGLKYAMPSGAKARRRARAIATFFIVDSPFFEVIPRQRLVWRGILILD